MRDMKIGVAGFTFLIIGASTAFIAYGYRLGTAANMGPGYVPFFAGLALCIVGVAAVWQGSRRTSRIVKIDSFQLRAPLVVLGSVALFGVLTEYVGIAVSIPALVGVSAFAHPNWSLRQIAISILILLPMSWLIFIRLIGVPLNLLTLE